MNYGFTIPDFRGGGAEQVLINIANYLAKSEVVYLFVGSNKGKLKSTVASNVRVIELSGSSSGLKNLYSLYRSVKKHKVNYLCGTLAMAFVVPFMSIFIKNLLSVSRIGNTLSSDIKNRHFLKVLLIRLYYYTLSFSDVIVCQSDYMKNDLLTLVPHLKHRKIKVIRNPINTRKLNVLDFTPKVRQFRIVSIGRLEYQKDLYTSLDVINKLVKSNVDVEFIILGEGSLCNSLKSYTKEIGLEKHVVFSGFDPNPHILLASADLLLLTSLYEGYSNVILESLCLGVPVVATDSPGGNSEIIECGKNGYLSPVGDYFGLAEKVSLILLNKTIPKNSFDTKNIRDIHSIKIISQEYLNLKKG